MWILRPDQARATPSWKIVAAFVCAVVICGGVIAWRSYKSKTDERKRAEAARICRISAEQGDVNAEARLGNMYFYGEGVPQDYAEALLWYRKAADKGEAKAQYAIGYMFELGQGEPVDYAQAAVWYRKAADQGYSKAQVGLGSMYYKGRGVPQDRSEAARWYRLAADQGLPRAEYDLGYAYYYGQGVPQDRALADRWYHMAADQGDASAQLVLGLRRPPLKQWLKITHTIIALGSLYLLMSLWPPWQDLRDRGRLFQFLAGSLGLLCIALDVYQHSTYCVFPSVLAANIFDFGIHLLTGIGLSMLFLIVSPKSPRMVLIASGILFLAVNLMFVAVGLFFLIQHRSPRFFLTFPAFFRLEVLPIGAIISAGIVLWTGKGKTKGSQNGDGKLMESEVPAENNQDPGTV